ncbi:MAG: helix-turn-helix transcriptional regulator [Bacteroidales bacterium]
MKNKIIKKLETKTKTKAQILDKHHVYVQTPDGEVFNLLSSIGKYDKEETRLYYLHLIETIFDANFSDDKETMSSRIWKDLTRNGVDFLGMNSGNRQSERVRIGKQIRFLRKKKGMEARELALLAGIDAANLCRIEQGKYSFGIDILSRIAFVLGAHIDLVANKI